MSQNNITALVYEHMLIVRNTLPGETSQGEEVPLDRSATVLLARLVAQGPMTVAQLADALELDVSTVHRQVAAAMKRSLIDRVEDPFAREARRHVASKEGRRRLAAELSARADAVENVVADWTYDELDTFVRLLSRFNQGLEAERGRLWPR